MNKCANLKLKKKKIMILKIKEREKVPRNAIFYFGKRECRMLFYFSINATMWMWLGMFPWVASCREYLIFVFEAGHIFFLVKSRIITFLLFWFFHCDGCESVGHTHIISLISCHSFFITSCHFILIGCLCWK